MTQTKSQAVLHDVSSTGRERPWREHKVSAEYLAMAYDSVDPAKAERIRECSKELTFRMSPEGLRLANAWFCRVRLCPTCTWRKSLKVGAQMHTIMAQIAADQLKLRYVMLTLTMRNVSGDQLTDALDLLNGAFQRLTQRKRVKDAMKGWYKGIEITHNLKDDTYHPHIHAILAVPPSYFGKGYIKQDDWTSLWKDALRADYTPIVDIRTVKGNTAAAVAEAAKYTMKPSDYIIPDDWDMTVDTVRLLDAVLANRRFVAYGGIFKEIARKLKLKDVEDDTDLVHIDGDEPDGPSDAEITFVWYSGYRQYINASEAPL